MIYPRLSSADPDRDRLERASWRPDPIVVTPSRQSLRSRRTTVASKHDKSKSAKRGKRQPVTPATPEPPSTAQFDEVVRLIEAARSRAVSSVNRELIELYWSIGATISRRIAADGWGQGTVQALADYIQKRHPGMRGFSAQNLWRMRQFHDAYHGQPKLSALLRELSWTHNLLIL